MKRATLAAAVVSMACGVGAELATEDAEVSAGTAYFTAERDQRKCPSPACGGWWLREVNRTGDAIYVSSLDLSRAGLDDASLVWNAGPRELLLRGKLRDAERGTQKLAVWAAYRGQPNAAPSAADEFLSVAEQNIVCVTAPCERLLATRLNVGGASRAGKLEVERSCRPFADDAFMENRVLAHGALVAGRVSGGAVDAGQVYLRLPLRFAPCPAVKVAKCPDGQVNTWRRTADLCMIPDGCAAPANCPETRPACETGYTPSTWPAQPAGCTQLRCDPSFVVP